MGGDPAALLAELRAPQRQQVTLWAVNLPAWAIWGRVQTQWRRAGMTGAITGLDYTAVARVADVLGTPLTPSLLDDIAACEAVALDIARRREEEARARG
ncbi:DUF1799 domain-containing protein [Tistrella mobilis]|uniref:DUF1799 domain-containing protein n=1 Tax=Tistrella mobilis TaxID=171437 RepID=UPI0035561472